MREISRWGRKWRWGQSSKDGSSGQGDEGEGENSARNSKESSMKWYRKEVTWDGENTIEVIWGKLYELLIYDDILRLSSTMPGKCTFTFSMKENWFLRFFHNGSWWVWARCCMRVSPMRAGWCMRSSCGFLDGSSGGRFRCCLPCIYLTILGDYRRTCFLLSLVRSYFLFLNHGWTITYPNVVLWYVSKVHKIGWRGSIHHYCHSMVSFAGSRSQELVTNLTEISGIWVLVYIQLFIFCDLVV